MASFDMQEYARLWRDRQGRFANRIGQATETLRQRVERLSVSSMQQLIYSRPEDTSSTGRKIWTRTEALLKSEKAVLGAQGEVRLTNDQVYARPRHQLGDAEHPVKKPGWNRRAPWRDAIRDEARKAQLEEYERAVRQALEAL